MNSDLDAPSIRLTPVLIVVAGGLAGTIFSFLVVGAVVLTFGEDNWFVHLGKFIGLAGMGAGIQEGRRWAKVYEAKRKMPWSQKRQGGPILPGASPEFMKQVNERNAKMQAARPE